MNESQYAKGIWARMGKVGANGQKFLDTGYLDSAFGGADARRAYTLQRIGQSRDLQNKRLDQSAENAKNYYDYHNQEMTLRSDAMSDESRDALTGDIISGLSLPVAFVEGRNRSNAIDDDTARQLAVNRKYRPLMGEL